MAEGTDSPPKCTEEENHMEMYNSIDSSLSKSGIMSEAEHARFRLGYDEGILFPEIQQGGQNEGTFYSNANPLVEDLEFDKCFIAQERHQIFDEDFEVFDYLHDNDEIGDEIATNADQRIPFADEQGTSYWKGQAYVENSFLRLPEDWPLFEEDTLQKSPSLHEPNALQEESLLLHQPAILPVETCDLQTEPPLFHQAVSRPEESPLVHQPVLLQEEPSSLHHPVALQETSCVGENETNFADSGDTVPVPFGNTHVSLDSPAKASNSQVQVQEGNPLDSSFASLKTLLNEINGSRVRVASKLKRFRARVSRDRTDDEKIRLYIEKMICSFGDLRTFLDSLEKTVEAYHNDSLTDVNRDDKKGDI